MISRASCLLGSKTLPSGWAPTNYSWTQPRLISCGAAHSIGSINCQVCHFSSAAAQLVHRPSFETWAYELTTAWPCPCTSPRLWPAASLRYDNCAAYDGLCRTSLLHDSIVHFSICSKCPPPACTQPEVFSESSIWLCRSSPVAAGISTAELSWAHRCSPAWVEMTCSVQA